MKFILVGILLFLLYRLVFKPKKLDETPMEDLPVHDLEEDGFVDYEELE